MQVTLETTSGLKRRMRISVPAEQFESKVEGKLKEAAGQVKIKGFRPGKVPMREVRRRFAEGIRQEVSSELMQASFTDAIRQESLAPAGMPQIQDVVSEAGKDFEFTAEFEVFPEIELADFGLISVERPVAEITETDIDAMIETLREQRKAFADVTRASQVGDQLNIDFEGFVDDEAFEGGKAEGSELVLGSNSMIPGFEDGLVGSSAGDEKDITVTFPEAYQAEALAGKEALFKIKVNAVAEPALPALDEAFFEQFGVKEGGLQAFRVEVRSNMEKELAAVIKSKVKNQVLDGLAETNLVDVPQALVDSEVDRMRQEAVQQFGGSQKIDPSILPAEMFTAQATKRVQLGLMVNAIVEQKTLKVDHERVKQMIDTMASSYEDPEEVINYYYANEQQLNQIQNLVLEDQVIDSVLAGASVVEKTMGYEEAIKPATKNSLADESEASADEGLEAPAS
ncbi:MAG: trigger factor [Pseudomonadales bacterium]|jgi:trigger factor|nr:trigger factor [Pseudomonadales bacterium]MDP4876162.1 trigger factor [Pseudomonadales bacterium]MDP4912005.1 trigger factor [Pseudomonadales bacterium]MDP5058209.1 trigger factor [Pseudomonadales bacterium]